MVLNCALEGFSVELQGKRVTVFGLNRSGVAAAKLLRRYGTTVTVTDTRSAEALSAEIAALDAFLKSDETSNLYRNFSMGIRRNVLQMPIL